MFTQPNLGSVYQRAHNDRWVTTLSISGGKRVTRYARHEREAQAALQALVVEHHAGTRAAPTSVTLAKSVARWLNLSAPNLRPSAVWTCCAALRPVVHEVGHVHLDKLTPLLLTGTLAKLQQQGKGSRALPHTWRGARRCSRRRGRSLTASSWPQQGPHHLTRALPEVSGASTADMIPPGAGWAVAAAPE